MAIAQNYPNIVPSLSLDFASVKALDPRITFNRASTATYYGTETAKAEENLFINSVWAGAVTGTPGTAPTSWAFLLGGGTLTVSGESIEFFAAAGQRQAIGQNIVVTAGQVITLSVDVDSVAGTASAVVVMLEPLTGTFTSTTNVVVSDGTGRKTASTACTVGGILRLRFGASVTSTTADDCTVSMKSPQIEIRSAATAYTPTTTQPITNFIPVLESAASGVARFDHNPVTKESLGLLIEEQRTNLLLRSEEFDNAGWTKMNSTVTANTIVAPDGTLTGDKLVATATNTPHDIRRSFGATSGKLMVSLYAKKGEFTAIQITSFSNTSEFANFDLSTGTVSRVGPQTPVNQCGIVDVGNGWYRCNAFIAPSGSGIIAFTAIQSPTAGWSEAFSGNGFDGIFIWGAQSENADFPTSYIPTSASQVTRAADAASMTGANFSSWYNQAEGTLYAEAAGKNTTNGRIYSVSDGTATNRIMSFYNGNFVQNTVTNAGASQASFATAIANASVANKSALAYAFNDVAGTANASNVSTDTSANIPVVTLLRIGMGEAVTANTINGTISKLSYYPVRVTNEQLQGLTS